MQVEFSAFVEGDLDAIAEWIAQDSPARALQFLQEIRDTIHRVEQDPLLYQVRPEIGDDARIAIVSNYVILFRIVQRKPGELVRIERIVYGSRDLPQLIE